MLCGFIIVHLVQMIYAGPALHACRQASWICFSLQWSSLRSIPIILLDSP